MTFREMLGVIARRWYVVLAAFAVAALLLVAFAQGGGVYSSKTVVTFTLPDAGALSPDNGTTDASVITFAGAVAAEINRGKPTPRYSSGDAPYYGAGVREGVLVSLRDDGSQWAPNYGSAVIEIQIVGQTEAWVAAQQNDILAQIRDITAAQLGTNTAANDRISAHVEPLTTTISHITSSRSAQGAAVAAMLIAALLVGAGGAVITDRLARRMSRRADRTITAEGIAA